jgi:DNA-binding CsgD family transcriptional regulator
MTVVRRLAFLDPASLDLLRTGSVLGGSFSAAELSVVTGKPLLDVLTTLREPIASGFVTSAGDRFAFRHDVVREALYLELPPPVRKGLHLHVGRSLAAAGAAAGEVANHLALGAEFGDREAVAWLRRAATELRPQAPGSAVHLLERAASLLPPEDPDHVPLVQEEIWTLAMAGRVREAEALAGNAAAQVSDPAAALELSIAQVELLLHQFRAREAEDLADRLLGAGSLPEEARAKLLVWSVTACIVLGDLGAAMARIAEVVPFVEAHPGSFPAMYLLAVRAGAALTQGFWGEAAKLVELVALRPDHPSQTYVQVYAEALPFYVAVFQIGADRFDEARATLDGARARLECIGNVSLMVVHHWFLAALHFAAGGWDDALAEVATSRQVTAETGALLMRVMAADYSPLIHLHRGDVTGARDALATIEGDPTHGATTYAGLWTRPMRALVEDGAGQPEAAAHTLETWHEWALGMAFLPDYRSVGRGLVRICQAQGKKQLAERMATDAAEARRRSGGVASVEGTALLLQGMVEEDPDPLLAAVEAFRASPRPFNLAEACAEAAVTLLARGRDSEGRALLAEAFDLYDELGASRPEAALAQEVRAFGIRRGARGRRQRALSGWSALTGTEERIVGLVAEGLTNAEIGERLYISRGTVATHLRSVFRKLDISSRTELAAAAARRL